MSENERVVRRFYDCFNEGDAVGAAQQYAEHCEWDAPAFSACAVREMKCSLSASDG